MKSLIFAVLVIFGLALAIGGRGYSDAQEDPGIEQGVQQIDSYLQQGLTPETHDTIARNARESADWLKSIEQRAVEATR